MKYSLIIVLVLFLCSGMVAQDEPFIEGDSSVCPYDFRYYTINDSRCFEGIDNIEWYIEGGSWSPSYSITQGVYWDFPEDEVGLVGVTYDCLTTGGGVIFVDNLELDIDYREIQTPFFDTPTIDLTFGVDTSFVIPTPDQGVGFTYSWTFPECISGTNGSFESTITPDLVAAGTICLTVKDPECLTTHTECIEITRSCEDTKTFVDTDPPVFTSVNLVITTSGNVVTSPSNVEFKAGEAIYLNPGFCANADFLAHIGKCGGTPGSGCIWPETSGFVSANDINSTMETSISKSSFKTTQSEKVLRDWKEVKLLISPNPTMDYFTISVGDFDQSKKYNYDILSLGGKTLLKGQISSQQTVVDINNLSKGIYLVKVYTERDITITRLIKY